MLTSTDARVICVRNNSQVTILQTSVDFNDLPWNTVTKMCPSLGSPGLDLVVEYTFRRLLSRQVEYGTLFINPQFLVQSPRPTGRFFREAKRAQKIWFRNLNSVFFSPARVKRIMRPLTPLLRQLYHTGVMFIS